MLKGYPVTTLSPGNNMSKRPLTASDRSALLKLASSLPKGDETRRAVLAGLRKVGMEFDTKEALEKYLKEHPNADKSMHSVKETKAKASPAESSALDHVDGVMGRGQGAYFKKSDPKGFQAFQDALEKGGPAVEAALDVASVMDSEQQKAFSQALKKKSPYEAAVEVLGEDDPELADRAESLKKHPKANAEHFSKANKAVATWWDKYH